MNWKIFKAISLIVFMIVAAGCFFPIIDDSTVGTIRSGPGSRRGSEPSSPANSDNRLVASVDYSTTFDRSVSSSIDNFFDLYTSDPDDPTVNRWIEDFFMPAKQLLGQQFEFDPTVKIRVAASEESIYATVAQPEWREVTKADPSFKRFLPLVKGDDEDPFVMMDVSGNILGTLDVEAIHWRSNVSTKITAISAKKLRYSTTLELDIVGVLSDGKGTKIKMPVTMQRKEFSDLADHLFKSLYSDYIELFEREYGLVVMKKSS